MKERSVTPKSGIEKRKSGKGRAKSVDIVSNAVEEFGSYTPFALLF